MSVLIQPDTFQVLRPSRTLDDHGWAEDPAFTELGEIKGTLQEGTPADSPRQSEEGGYGQADPMHRRLGTAYLTSEVQPGDILVTRGRSWRAQAVHFTEDPRGTGELDCWVVTASEVINHG